MPPSKVPVTTLGVLKTEYPLEAGIVFVANRLARAGVGSNGFGAGDAIATPKRAIIVVNERMLCLVVETLAVCSMCFEEMSPLAILPTYLSSTRRGSTENLAAT